MQHRRTAAIDATLGADMALNETESKDGPGLKINAEYNMQIFNFNSGKSLQREQQIKIDQPMEYFFSFDKIDFSKASVDIADDKSGEPVKDANIIHKVIKPAPTYIKEVGATDGVANPAAAPKQAE
jgi:hypothetical protein